MADFTSYDREASLGGNNEDQLQEQAETIEALKQELYTMKNRLIALQKTEAEYESEKDYMLQQLQDAKTSHDHLILKLKQDHAFNTHQLEQQLQVLEKDVVKLRDENTSLKDDLELAKNTFNDVKCEEKLATLQIEFNELSEEHAKCNIACEQHKELNKILSQEKTDLLQEIIHTKEYLEFAQEKVKICNEHQSTQSATIEDLRNSLAVAQAELVCLRSGPSDVGARGNSLFAEVEDKRQAMAKRCSSLSTKYNEMKNDYTAKCEEISRLKLENLQLRRKWQEEEEEREKRDVWLSDNYEIRIKELMKSVEDLEKRETPVFVEGNSKVLVYAEQVVEKSRKELALLRDEMEWRSAERLNEAKALYAARCDVENLKSQLMTLNAENIVLRDKLQAANISDIPSPGKTLKLLKRALQSSDQEHLPAYFKSPQSSNNGSDYSGNKPALSSEYPCASTLESAMDTYTNDLYVKGQSHSSLQKNCVALSSTGLPEHRTSPEHVCIDSPKAESSPMDEDCVVEDSSHTTQEHQNSIDLSLSGKQSVPCQSETSPSLASELAYMDSSNLHKPGEDFHRQQNFESPVTQKVSEQVMCASSTSEETQTLQDAELEENDSESLEGMKQTEFLYPNVIEPMQVLVAEKIEKLECQVKNNLFDVKARETVTEENSLAFQKPTFFCKDQLQKPKEPRRSILMKAPRPHLVPVDQNSKIRKISFVDNEKPTRSILVGSDEDTSGDSPKKKLVKMSQPKLFKTRIVVSKDIDSD